MRSNITAVLFNFVIFPKCCDICFKKLLGFVNFQKFGVGPKKNSILRKKEPDCGKMK